MASEHTDVLRESVAWLVAELMEAEVSTQIGAELGERGPGERASQRNGYSPRSWSTRAGRSSWRSRGSGRAAASPSFLEPRKRSERTLVAVVQESYVNGVSTRKVDRLVEQLGGAGVSKDQVSRLCQGLDDQVAAFRERPFEGRHPYPGSTPRSSASESGAACRPGRPISRPPPAAPAHGAARRRPSCRPRASGTARRPPQRR